MKESTQLALAFAVVGVMSIIACYFMISSSSTSVSTYTNDSVDNNITEIYDEILSEADYLIVDVDTISSYDAYVKHYDRYLQLKDSLNKIQH